MSKSVSAPGWDLSDTYKSVSDPKIEKDKKEITASVKKFTKKYKNEINSFKLAPNFLLKALKDYEAIYEKVYILEYYSSFLFSTNSKSDKIKRFFQEIQEFATRIDSEVLWFNLEWIRVGDKVATRTVDDPVLTSYKHFLTKTRVMKPFTLSEKEEKILNDKSQTSNQAFIRLYDQTESSEKFELEVNGKKEILNSSGIGSIMQSHPKRKVREEAAIVYSKTFGKNANLYSYILNTLLLDKKVIDETRNFEYPQQETFLKYEINPNTVENMTRVVSDNVKLVERFYLAKRKLLKLKKLHEWDRYSNVYSLKNKNYSWEESKKIILECFKEFSPVFYDTAKLFFDNNWIDACVKDGKRSGGYCSYGVPSTHPMILVNFSGKVEDVTTLAHELGHAIHAYLSRKQTLLLFWPSTAVAEIASIFAENMVFEKLYNTTSDKREKINLLAGKIQNSFATIFRQNDFYNFEIKLHKLRREKGELSENEIGKLYNETLQKTFGKGLTLTDLHKNFWMPVSHFYHYNFYVFTYVFGELLAVSLIAQYKLNKDKFVKKYIEALSYGGLMTPYEITELVGIDLNKKDFWQKGIGLLEKEIEVFVNLSR